MTLPFLLESQKQILPSPPFSKEGTNFASQNQKVPPFTKERL